MPHVMPITADVAIETFPVAGAFTISRGATTEIAVVRVTLSDGRLQGTGECRPYARYGETPEGVAAAIRAALGHLGPKPTRAALATHLAPGAARNAIDCALWDLEANRAGKPVWQLAGLARPKPLTTLFTISWGSTEAMSAAARRASHRPLLKVKLGAGPITEHLAAVRSAAPRSRLVVDANEAWDATTLATNLEACAAVGIELIEQPVPAGQDHLLAGITRPIALCADESAHDQASIAALRGLYDSVNIKLDKTGGLTEALAMREAARGMGLEVMVGCMLGTSLAMAPAVLVAQGADWVDLDAPLLLAADRPHPIRYEGSVLNPAPSALWGGPDKPME